MLLVGLASFKIFFLIKAGNFLQYQVPEKRIFHVVNFHLYICEHHPCVWGLKTLENTAFLDESDSAMGLVGKVKGMRNAIITKLKRATGA